MPAHAEQQILPYSPQQLFDMVADIERYPEFLPWCRAARITEREGNSFLGELVISFHHLTERYTSRVTLQRPPEGGEGTIDVTMVKGPFAHLVNHWRFVPHAEGGTRVDFSLDFQFRSRMLEKMIGGLFGKATARMVTAFRQRADALYGPGA